MFPTALPAAAACCMAAGPGHTAPESWFSRLKAPVEDGAPEDMPALPTLPDGSNSHSIVIVLQDERGPDRHGYRSAAALAEQVRFDAAHAWDPPGAQAILPMPGSLARRIAPDAFIAARSSETTVAFFAPELMPSADLASRTLPIR
jgi:hypothetical protein